MALEVAIAEDIGQKLLEIIAAEGIDSVAFLDPLVRREIENRHRANLPAIRAIRASDAAQREFCDADPVMSNTHAE